MSRKAREDRSSWYVPSLHVFVGDYGPFKPPRNSGPIENALVLLTSSLGAHNPDSDVGSSCSGSSCDATSCGSKDKEDFVVLRRHPLYKYAAQAQKLLLDDYNQSSRHIIIVDVADMLTGGTKAKEDSNTDSDSDNNDNASASTLSDVIQKENDSREPVKGFGKTLLRLFQRLDLRNVKLAAEGELCCVLLKLYDALLLGGGGSDIAVEDIWLLHPVLPANFVNNVLVPMGNGNGNARRSALTTKTKKKHGKNKSGSPRSVSVISSSPSTSLQLHLVFQDDAARDKRLGMIRHVFPDGTTSVTPKQETPHQDQGSNCLSVMFDKKSSSDESSDGDTTTLQQQQHVYDPDYCNELGKSLYLSTLTVEMNKYSKQYERTSEDITADLMKVEEVSSNNGDNGVNDAALELKNIDWNSCERHVGALVLRGNRCVLVRSLSSQWKGMRFPSVVPKPGELHVSAAIRSVVEFAGVEESEVTTLSEMISPVTVYAPNGRSIVVELYVLYATAPPPDGPLEDADMEDDETPYDWYTYANAAEKLDDRSTAALRSMSFVLSEAADAGVLPRKWGGVFGQDLVVSTSTDAGVVPNGTTLVESGKQHQHSAVAEKGEEWKPSRQGDMLQDVRKANADILSRLSSDRKDGQPYKLPVTLLSGFLGSGKTTLLTHILTNYSGLKVAILVNDMGEINIDAALLSKHSITQQEEHLVEMSNGCICCTLREDLLVEVAKIASQGTFDYLIIESTGVSEPMPVAETFTFEDSTGLRLGDIAQIDTLVTVVDGSRFLSELDSIQSLREREWQADPEDQRTISHLLCDQVEFANVITLNKCDLMNDHEKNQVKRLIKHMNPTANIIESVFSKVPLDNVLGTGLFSMGEAESHDGWLKEARIGEHTPETLEYGIGSFTYRARKPFFPHKLNDAIEAMLNQTAPFDESLILRSKGFVWLANFPALQGDFSLAGNHFSLVPGNPWWAEIEKEHWPEGLEVALGPLWQEPFGDRQQEIVIIGKDLNRDLITKALDECLLSDGDVKLDQVVLNEMCAEAGDPFYENWYSAIENAANDAENGHSHDHHHEHHHD